MAELGIGASRLVSSFKVRTMRVVLMSAVAALAIATPALAAAVTDIVVGERHAGPPIHLDSSAFTGSGRCGYTDFLQAKKIGKNTHRACTRQGCLGTLEFIPDALPNSGGVAR